MNLPAASGRGILIDQLFPYRPKGRGIKPEEIKHSRIQLNMKTDLLLKKPKEKPKGVRLWD